MTVAVTTESPVLRGRGRIVVVGDTHLPRFGRVLPRPLVEAIANADLVLHCGDLTEEFVLDLLGQFAPTVAVAGNNDGPELLARLGLTRVVEFAGARIGLTHGHAGPGRTTPDRAVSAFADLETPLDAICFGHSHIPRVERRGATWLLNPGSPTDRRRQPTFSYLVIDVADGALEPRLETYERRS
jgi:putative phosphoesterase